MQGWDQRCITGQVWFMTLGLSLGMHCHPLSVGVSNLPLADLLYDSANTQALTLNGSSVSQWNNNGSVNLSLEQPIQGLVKQRFLLFIRPCCQGFWDNLKRCKRKAHMPVSRKTSTYKKARASVKTLKQESRNIQKQAKQNAKRLDKVIQTLKK